jgi:hypothetical protein
MANTANEAASPASDAHEKLSRIFGIDVEVPRRIGTFIVLCSMVEQQAEFVLLQRRGPGNCGPSAVDRMTMSERLKAIHALNDPAIPGALEMAARLGELLTNARHTIAHGAPTGWKRLERNRSWFGEHRKRPFAALSLSMEDLDGAALIGDTLFRQLASIGAHLAGEPDFSAAAMPNADEIEQALAVADRLQEAMSRNPSLAP